MPRWSCDGAGRKGDGVIEIVDGDSSADDEGIQRLLEELDYAEFGLDNASRRLDRIDQVRARFELVAGSQEP